MCLDPMTTKNSGDIPVPCGRCVECKARRASAWSFRLMQETKRCSSAHFITLTYSNENATSLLTRNGFLSLVRRDLELFWKRLRKLQDGHFSGLPPIERPKIRYYAVGEYGDTSFRPHFHAIVFNAVLKLIQPAWEKGEIHYGQVTPASVGYCLKYISKNKRIPMHRNDDREPEYSVMSKELGTNYLTEQMVAWHRLDLENRMFLNLTDGKKISMPRYYKDRIYTDAERETISESARVKANRTREARTARAMAKGEKILTAREIQCNAQELIEKKAKRKTPKI